MKVLTEIGINLDGLIAMHNKPISNLHIKTTSNNSNKLDRLKEDIKRMRII